MDSLSQHFHRYFSLQLALTEPLKKQVFALRYHVYGEELGFENVANFPEKLESDRFDVRAVHGLLIHKPTGLSAGCFRLICNTASDASLLPFEDVCNATLDDTEWHPSRIQRKQFGEISRLAVHANFRRRTGEQQSPIGVVSDGAHEGSSRQYPLVASGLFLGATALALACGLDRVYVMMEPRLARLLRSCGLMFKQVGDIIDYHGNRGPFMISRELLYPHLPPDARLLMDEFRAAFAQNLTSDTQ